MILTRKQCELLLSIFNASIQQAMSSGIPIGKEYYEDIDIIKNKIYEEMREAVKKEKGGSRP